MIAVIDAVAAVADDDVGDVACLLAILVEVLRIAFVKQLIYQQSDRRLGTILKDSYLTVVGQMSTFPYHRRKLRNLYRLDLDFGYDLDHDYDSDLVLSNCVVYGPLFFHPRHIRPLYFLLSLFFLLHWMLLFQSNWCHC